MFLPPQGNMYCGFFTQGDESFTNPKLMKGKVCLGSSVLKCVNLRIMEISATTKHF